MIRLIFIFILIFGLGAGVYLVQKQQTIKSKATGSPPPKVDRGPLTKVTFIHYRRGAAKPPPDSANKPSAGTCYSYIASGAKWKAPADYLINPTNSGLENTLIQQSVAKGVIEWERYGGSNIFGLGNSDPTATIGANNDSKNVVSFGPYPNNDAIAITTVWGYFSGDPTLREIVEWDMQFNNYYQFGDASVNGSAVMDLQNVATHELGHGAGMADLYSGGCSVETMYGYSAYGEIIKRDLSNGDIQGIRKLYR